MTVVHFRYELADGSNGEFLAELSEAEISRFEQPGSADTALVLERRLDAFLADMEIEGKVTTWHVDLSGGRPHESQGQERRADSRPGDPSTARPSGDVSRSRSLLTLANRLLPPAQRQDALDEWMDEIETAAEEGLPVRRRALSIVFRSLPVLALRSRLPARVRGGGG